MTNDDHRPDELPSFRYHPDPIATGSIRASDEALCRRCSRNRGFIYVGPVYSIEELVEELCPWCVADGSAAETFDAAFTDVGWGVPSGVPAEVIDEVEHRTPSYSSWQQDFWLYHCDDACAFLGPIGQAELRTLAPEATEAFLAWGRETAGWPESQVQEFVRALDRDGQPTGYLFRCLHCDTYLGHADFT